MRLVAVINGWAEAPHYWQVYLSNPVSVDKICVAHRYCYHEITIIGFVFFIEFK